MKAACSVRPLTAKDEPFLWEMLYHAIFVPEGQPPPERSILKEPSLARYVLGWATRPGDLGFTAVMRQEMQPVGAAWLRLFTASEPGYGFVSEEIPELSIAVLPAYRGQGVGTLLLDTLLQAAANTYSAVSLSVSTENPAAGLYKKIGFQVISEDASTLKMIKHL